MITYSAITVQILEHLQVLVLLEGPGTNPCGYQRMTYRGFRGSPKPSCGSQMNPCCTLSLGVGRFLQIQGSE